MVLATTPPIECPIKMTELGSGSSVSLKDWVGL